MTFFLVKIGVLQIFEMLAPYFSGNVISKIGGQWFPNKNRGPQPTDGAPTL
jgi:hypothetical protein